ncbi:MAG TPA: IclR family transcriptional regulator [Streptosporangiaceae bacterium]|jgi:DNA-binding IclR family transcriptional regulator
MTETSKTVDHALRLLTEIGARGPGTVAELAHRLGVPRTVAHRLLATLRDHGFVHRGPDARYALGVALFDLANQVEARLRDVAAPLLAGLAEDLDETAILTIRDGAEAVAVDQYRAGRTMVTIDYHPGIHHPLTVAAAGLAILAWSDDAQARRAVDAVRDPAVLRTRLAAIRGRGYAQSAHEFQPGVCGVSAPIFGTAGAPIASIGIVTPAARFTSEHHFAPPVTEAAAAATAALTTRA